MLSQRDVSLDRMIFLTATRIKRLYDDELARIDPPLTSRQYQVLALVRQGYDSPTELARLARRTLSTLSEAVEGLVVKGLLVRATRDGDRRGVMLALTDDGRALLDDADERTSALAATLLTGIGADDEAKSWALFGEVFDRAGELLAGHE